jgi:hypothetical protein
MRGLLQLVTLVVLAVDAASIVLLYWSSDAAGQDAAGSGMAGGLMWVAIAAAAIGAVLLLVSYARRSAGIAFVALLVAVIPAVPIVLPALT